MKYGKLKEVTGKFVRESYDYLTKEQMGCCSICFAQDRKYDYAVCIGWHDCGDGPKEDNYRHWVIAWKIGRQTHNSAMQCDLDIDFEMPYNEEYGDVDDTLETIEAIGGKPIGYISWDSLAKFIRTTAKRVWNDWKEVEE